MHPDTLYLVWLTSATAIGSPLLHTLLKYFGSARAVWEAKEADFAALAIDWRGRMKPLLDKNLDYAERVLAYCEENGVAVTTLSDHFYPKRLRDLSAPPAVLYHIGAFCDLDRAPCVTVVGTRHPSEYATRAAKRLCVDLARGGATLVSGLALGIDGICHRAALWSEAFTVGVLGCGIDRVYPKEHADLIREVGQKGLVLTEYAPGTPPLAHNFPMRNRILAALSPVTLVVEASAASGSLITAEHCIRLKRELFSVPGSVFSAQAAGSNHLLHCGAKAALRAEDILSVLSRTTDYMLDDEIRARISRLHEQDRETFAFAGSRTVQETGALPPAFSGKVPKPAKALPRRIEKCPITDLDDLERTLIARLTHEPVLPDTLVDDTLTPAMLAKLLTKLELKGYVERTSGSRVCLTDDAQA